MTSKLTPDTKPDKEPDKHPIQRLMDNVWLLLVLGFLIPTVSYTLWAWIEVLRVPQATLP
jgi:hypothetical protein